MQRICIKNFNVVKDADIDIENVLLLIGEQASGKSTISKIIYFFKSLRIDLLRLINEHKDSNVALAPLFRKRIRDKFYNYFGSTRHVAKFNITYYYSPNKYIQLSLNKDHSLRTFISESFYTKIFNEARRLMRKIEEASKKNGFYETIEAETAIQSYRDELQRIMNQLFEDDHEPLFIPAGRNITVTYSEQFQLYFFGDLNSILNTRKSKDESIDMYLMLEFLHKVKSFSDRFKGKDFLSLIRTAGDVAPDVNKQILFFAREKIADILKGEYRHDEYGEKIYYSQKEYVHLNNASSGQQEAIRILQDIFFNLLDQANVFRVIEEPEAHLYPDAQKQLIEMIAVMLNSSDSQVVITTHSPYILSIFNNLLFATKVVKTNENLRQAVDTIIPQLTWLHPHTFQAYCLEKGKATSIFDETTGMIEENFLDDISDDMGSDFDTLYQFYRDSLKNSKALT